MTLRHRAVEAVEPGAEPICRLTREEGLRRQADTERLFAALSYQREMDDGRSEWCFSGDPGALWDLVSVFVDEESQCCPFFTFEQIERPDGIILHVSAPVDPGRSG